MKINIAKFVRKIIETDPDSQQPVEMSVFKHKDSGAMFAIDDSYLDQCFDDDMDPLIPDPFNEDQKLSLHGA